MKTKLKLFGPMDQRYVWRKKNEAYAEMKAVAKRTNKNITELEAMPMRNGLRFRRKAVRSWGLVMHHVRAGHNRKRVLY